jgi:hypothetical protein
MVLSTAIEVGKNIRNSSVWKRIKNLQSFKSCTQEHIETDFR